MGDTKLLPCPFCGNAPAYHTHKGVWRPHHVYHCVTIGCPAMHASMPNSPGPACPSYATEDEAAEKWNTRPALLARQEGEDAIDRLSPNYEAGFKAGMKFESEHRLLDDAARSGNGGSVVKFSDTDGCHYEIHHHPIP